jgi:indolepyruvate ferredoxin oxidoreductase, alpha subunit
VSLKMMTGNEALAWGALHAGVKVVTGYPGTPSTGALASLLAMDPEGVHVEWSVNEMVAFETVAGAAWAGQRGLCTMKMSGLNVCYDALISVAYSGIRGGLVVYVADDPGVNAGMPEQDSRGFALMSDLPMLEPGSADEVYRMAQEAFELSETCGSPVFIRLVTANSDSFAPVDLLDEPPVSPEREPTLVHDIMRYTKAGAAICMAQHRDLIARLEKAGEWIDEAGLNELRLGKKGGLGVVAAGIVTSYLDESFALARRYGFAAEEASVLQIKATHPFPTEKAAALLQHCSTIVILEELEPHLEKELYVLAQRLGLSPRIVGKLDGTFERIGEYGVEHVVRGLSAALGLAVPADLLRGSAQAEQLAAARPITVCAGCPHRGTFLAINKAIRKAGFKKGEVIVTGDIGCTILGMNPPFDTLWTEVAMGASVGLAAGYVHAGLKTPVIATIGDSTFYHAGIPGLINAVQHNVPLTLVIMDNGWTSMTGMQVNPGTSPEYQEAGDVRLDLARIVPALGVDQFWVVDPFQVDEMTQALQEAFKLPGVKVLLARQECVMPALRRRERAGKTSVIAENCNLCKLCITMTGCLAISMAEEAIEIDPAVCYGCGLCASVCNRDAITVETTVEAVR